MTEVDRVLKPIKVSFEGNVDLSELYHLIKSFMSDKKYDINEKEHNFSGNKAKIKWESTREITEYTQFQIEVTVSGSNLKKINLKKGEAFSGKFEVEIEAKINKDFNNYYEGKPIIKFFRELFDHIVGRDDFNRFNDQLKKESYSLFDEIKAYFGLQKLQ